VDVGRSHADVPPETLWTAAVLYQVCACVRMCACVF
jgi:hypothetical protein